MVAATKMMKSRDRRTHLGHRWRPFIESLGLRALPTVSYTPIDFSSFHNADYQNLQSDCADLPDGNISLGGIPYGIPTSGNNAWWGEAASGSYPRMIDIPINIANVTEAHSLITTSYGQPGPESYVALEFFGSDGAFHRVDFIGNEDVRDHFYASWTNFINNTTTTNVALSGTGGFHNECRLDKQHIELPPEFQSQTLNFVRVIDSGGVSVSGVIFELVPKNWTTD